LTGLKVGSRGGGFDCFDFGPALGGNGDHRESKQTDQEETFEASGEFASLAAEIPELRHVVLLPFGIFPDPNAGQMSSIVGKALAVNFYF